MREYILIKIQIPYKNEPLFLGAALKRLLAEQGYPDHQITLAFEDVADEDTRLRREYDEHEIGA